MTVRGSYIAVMLTVALLGGAACRSQNTAEEQKKVDDLQKQLDDAKQQLAAREGEIEAKAAETAAAAEENSKPGAPATGAAKPGRSPAKPAAKATPDQSRVETASVDQPRVDQQRDVNARQSETNERVQRDIEALKPVEYTLPAGTVIPVRTTTELSTSQLANGSTFRAVLERPLRVGDTVLAAQGAEVAGLVVSSDPGGKVKGVASLEVTIRSVAGRKNHTIPVKADHYSVVAEKSTGRDL